MIRTPLLALFREIKQYGRWGDVLVFGVLLCLIISLFRTFWHIAPAHQIQISVLSKVYGRYSLNQQREIVVQGALGVSHIRIDNGKVRFVSAPCTNQYCVHQGWLKQAGAVAFCLPNRVQIQLLGSEGDRLYDSLNY